METNEQNYDLSFFKPTNPRTRANRNLVLVLVIIWAVGVFGFQFLLKIIEKPTPEETLINYNTVKEKVYNGNASVDEQKTFVYALLTLEGRSINTDDKALVSDALSKVVFDFDLNRDSQSLLKELQEIKTAKDGLGALKPEEFKTKQAEIRKQEADIISVIAPVLGLQNNELRAKFLPLVLQESNTEFTPDVCSKLDDIMTKYFTHNQSVLTDTTFLGFPFHYFYTAVFLLIMFLALCWIYAYRIQKINLKYDFKE